MTETQFGVVVILALWLAALSAVCLANYAAGTLRHDDDEECR